MGEWLRSMQILKGIVGTQAYILNGVSGYETLKGAGVCETPNPKRMGRYETLNSKEEVDTKSWTLIRVGGTKPSYTRRSGACETSNPKRNGWVRHLEPYKEWVSAKSSFLKQRPGAKYQILNGVNGCEITILNGMGGRERTLNAKTNG